MGKISLAELKSRYAVFNGEVRLLKINIHHNICEDLGCQHEDIKEALLEYCSQPAYQALDKKGIRYRLDGNPYMKKQAPQTWEDCLKKWPPTSETPLALVMVGKQLKNYARCCHKLELLQLIPAEVKKGMKKLSQERAAARKAKKEMNKKYERRVS